MTLSVLALATLMPPPVIASRITFRGNFNRASATKTSVQEGDHLVAALFTAKF